MTSAKKSHISMRIGIFAIFMLLVSAIASGAAESDSQTFKKGLESFQKNRFSSAIKSFNRLLQSNPDTPLKDMALYYLARAHLKTGNKQKAAHFTNRLMHEFPASYNKGTIDAELLATLQTSPPPPDTGAAAKHPPAPQPKPVIAAKAKESHRPAKPLPAKVKAEQARPKAEVAKKSPAQQSRLASRAESTKPAGRTTKTAQAVQASPVVQEPPKEREKAAEGNGSPAVDTETVAAVDYSRITGKGTPSALLDISTDPVVARAGTRVTIPFTITNQGESMERFSIESGFPLPFEAHIAAASDPGTAVRRTSSLAPGEAFNGILMVTVPAESIDGLNFEFPVTIATPARAIPFSTSMVVRVTASAPLLRAMVTTRNTTVIPGQVVAYTVTLLNAGSAPAENVSLRLYCPPSYQAVDVSPAFSQSPEGLVLDRLEIGPGELREVNALFRVTENTAPGEEIICRADVIDNALKIKTSYLSGRAVTEKTAKAVDNPHRGN